MDKAENYKRLGLWIWIVFLNCLAALAGEPVQPKGNVPLGSPDFYPSPENPAGWRGDGTGRYPGATPPVHWGRICKQTAALKCAAAVPKDGSTANAASAGLGFFTEWLAAGPVPCDANPVNVIKNELTPGEAALAPQEGDKLGAAAWRKIKTDDSFVDLWAAFGGMTKEQAAYAQSCLYSAQACKIWLHYKCSRGAALWLNGALKHSACQDYPGVNGTSLTLDLQAGWNRFLFKLVPRCAGEASDFPSTCYVRCRFWPAEEPRDYEEKNIAWIAPMTGLSQATPVIAGERLFTMAYPYNLICVEKKSGKILWVRSNSPYDAATAEERKAHPDLFAKMDELAAKRDAYYQNFMQGKMPSALEVRNESDLEGELDKLIAQVDEKYSRPWQQGEPDWWTIPTPVTDGRSVCVWLTRGISASYDLDGKRRWIFYDKPKNQHHGYFCSPVIAAGKFIRYDGHVTALDLNDGAVKWSVDDGYKDRHESPLWFGSLSRCMAGTVEGVLWYGTGLLRAGDGKSFGPVYFGGDSTPVFTGQTLLLTFQNGILTRSITASADGGLAAANGKNLSWPWARLCGCPNLYQGHWLEASPLAHEGLGYAVSGSGVLAVFDVATMEPIYEKVLPLDLFQASPGRSYVGASLALAGPYIYLLGSTGVTILIQPGRKYEEVARNRLQYLAQTNFFPEGQRQPMKGHTLGKYHYESWGNPQYCPEYQDCTMTSTPIFDGNRMYFRGEENLYCIEEKKP